MVIDDASGEAGLGEEDGGELNEPARLAGEAVDDGDYSDDSVMGFGAADGRYVQRAGGRPRRGCRPPVKQNN